MNPFLLLLACRNEQNYSEVANWGSSDLPLSDVAQACLPPEISMPEDLTTGQAPTEWVAHDEIMELWQEVLGGEVYEKQIKENPDDFDAKLKLDFSRFADRTSENFDFINGVTAMTGVVSDFSWRFAQEDDNGNLVPAGKEEYNEFFVMPNNQTHLLTDEVSDVFFNVGGAGENSLTAGELENAEELADEYFSVNEPLALACSSTYELGEFDGLTWQASSVRYFISYRADTIDSCDHCFEMGASLIYNCASFPYSSTECYQEIWVEGEKIQGDAIDNNLFLHTSVTTDDNISITRLVNDIRAQTFEINNLVESVPTQEYEEEFERTLLLSGGFYNEP